MTATPDRRAELIAAAAAEELTHDEAHELDELRRIDPTVDLEIDELRELIRSVATAVPHWDAGEPSAGLRARVAEIADDGVSDGVSVSHLDRHRATRKAAPRRRWTVSILAAAACLVLGFGVGALVLPGGPSGPKPGTPGELGANEQIEFGGEPAGVDIDASVVAHTWGTETIMQIEGLTPGESYELWLIDDEGEPHASGSFTGSTVVIDCRMNTATLRPDAASLEIRDGTGALVTVASLPAVP